MKEIIFAEGPTLSSALHFAAEKLGIDPNLVDYSFDKEHFRTASGRNKGVETVKIKAWLVDANKKMGAEAAKLWMIKLTELMGIKTEVSYRITGEKSAEIILKSEQGGRLVGRNGSSLKSINVMFLAAMEKEYSDWKYRLEVSGRKRNHDDNRRNYDDNRRNYDDNRRNYDDNRRNYDDNRREKRSRVNNKDVKGLEKLASLLADKVLRSKTSLIMRQNLNSFERRVIHLTIQSIDGVITKSIMENGIKKIKILLESDRE